MAVLLQDTSLCKEKGEYMQQKTINREKTNINTNAIAMQDTSLCKEKGEEKTDKDKHKYKFNCKTPVCAKGKVTKLLTMKSQRQTQMQTQ